MRVLFAVWELAPFFQVGGLGDVARSLPKALFTLGIDIRVILPFYKALKLQGQRRKLVAQISIKYAGKNSSINIYKISFVKSKVPVYLLENDEYLSIPSKETFAFFNLTIIEIIKKNYLDWIPEIIHCNDHHTGFIPLLIKHNNLPIKTLFTIHNLQHKGESEIDTVENMNIHPEKCRLLEWEIKRKRVNFLLEGLVHADYINAVSPTYAKEILTEEYGAGLDEILRDMKDKLFGILNGIDYDSRDPVKDKSLIYHYGSSEPSTNDDKIYSNLEGKRLNKAFLQDKLGFEVTDKKPLIGFIGRLDGGQKGLEIIHKMLRRIDLTKFQFVFLGAGEKDWEERFNWLYSFYPKSIHCTFEFDKRLATQIYAGSDFLIIPSKFEPCGLIQMNAMRYGSIPVARATGGLKDSINDNQDGYLFKKYTSYDLEKRLMEAINVWRNDKKKHDMMIERAMDKDFSWVLSAKRYIDLYQKLINSNGSTID
jgi:starch synthase